MNQHDSNVGLSEGLDQVDASEVTELPAEVEIEELIKTYVVAAMAVALVPMPVFDAAAIVGVQIKMLHQMTVLYGHPFQNERARTIILSLIGGVFPVTLVMGSMSLLKSLPIIGSIGGTAGLVILAGATTYAVGRVFSKHLDEGGTLLSFDAKSASQRFSAELKKGRAFAKKMMPVVQKKDKSKN